MIGIKRHRIKYNMLNERGLDLTLKMAPEKKNFECWLYACCQCHNLRVHRSCRSLISMVQYFNMNFILQFYSVASYVKMPIDTRVVGRPGKDYINFFFIYFKKLFNNIVFVSICKSILLKTQIGGNCSIYILINFWFCLDFLGKTNTILLLCRHC